MRLRIGTRGSRLAMAQSEWVRSRILEQEPDSVVELVPIKTKGDKILDSPLSLVGGKGLFVKEIEEALLQGAVDAAVHSMKDIPAELPEGLCLAVFPEREDPRDALISAPVYRRFEELPRGARVGTSSLRRSAQLLSVRPDLGILSLRGNVDTRLAKLDSGEVDAVVLAAAGLRRLGLEKAITQALPIDLVLPAVGQGALGLEIREEDAATRRLLDFINHPETELRVRAERAFLHELQGGCQVPIAGHAVIQAGGLSLRGLVAELDGSRVIADQVTGDELRPEDLGRELAGLILSSGGGEILERVYKSSGYGGRRE
ncbi:MAG: hydroxymethylbilane synthase [Desulfobacteraceae bacterium]